MRTVDDITARVSAVGGGALPNVEAVEAERPQKRRNADLPPPGAHRATRAGGPRGALWLRCRTAAP